LTCNSSFAFQEAIQSLPPLRQWSSPKDKENRSCEGTNRSVVERKEEHSLVYAGLKQQQREHSWPNHMALQWKSRSQ